MENKKDAQANTKSIKINHENFVKENTGNIKEFYKISSCIGRGAYGEVRKCLHKQSLSMRAVKIINKKYLEDDEREKLLTEINILKNMDHPNILKLHEFFQDQKRYFLVTELCQGGELFDRISEQAFFSEKDAANIMKQLLSAISYCHSKSVVHRDLKPENILMDKDPKNPKVTIIDFGTSGVFKDKEQMKEKFGTPYYIAPEVLKKSYNQKCDIWSCGVILYILLCGYPPFNGSNDKQIIKAVLKGEYTLDEPEWHDVSIEAKDFIRKLLEYDSNKRITAQEALQHQWIKNQASVDSIDAKTAGKALKNLQNFRSDQKLKQATLAFIASHLTSNDEKKDLEKVFKQIDKDGDGQLTKEEILGGYEEHFGVPITEEQVDQMFEQIDIDGNGTIDYTEFVMATMNQMKLISNDKLEAAFRMFDKDNSGTISPDEIKEVLGFNADVSMQQIDQIIKEVDINGDGEIQFDEFCQMMKKLVISK